ncbi:MAG: hypothetical protein QOF60_86 [Actinomycetota bacterium]|nr:hypothetical protein [Actinomycetota bacterium]
MRDLLSAMFVSAAAAVGIAVVVGGGTAGIQTSLVAPAAGVTLQSSAPVMEAGRSGGPELSVRVFRPARLPMTGAGPEPEPIEVVAADGGSVGTAHARPALALRSPKAAVSVVVPVADPAPVVAVAAPVVPKAPTQVESKHEAKAEEPKTKPKQEKKRGERQD